ncbi:hypothetical protein KO566_00970 [Flavobacteriaceae bacterium XHP0103]|uniref:hypothetical protein n=1 Tax=Marixanthotalea marina TaxID=2844359 RepID=UPI002989C6C4|nr:hypothetical protein [Marixanthotalea marina]MBU3820615.1 hypothetical protein [Marixanthotalea marina]
MKRITFNLLFGTFVLLGLSLLSFSKGEDQKIKGWILAGSNPESYTIGVEKNADRNGNVAYLKSTKSKIKGFGTIMQSFRPTDYLGKKVKLTGYIKTTDVKDWTGMWMRVDGEKRGEVLSFDNMGDRPIKGTTSWTKYEIILEVPKTATNISYGVLMSGTGIALIDDFKFEIVNSNNGSTGNTIMNLTEPTNTSFEESN